MRASLPMYDFPEFRAETDAFWNEVRKAYGPGAPDTLEREDPWFWGADDLLLSQTCGWPWITGHAGTSQIVARPDVTVEGGGPGTYRSAIIVREEMASAPLADQAAIFTANSVGSLSGWIAARRWLARQGLTPRGVPDLLSGAHRSSVQKVRMGVATMAAIDAVTWHMVGQVDPVDGLVVLDWTEEAPALPYITAGHRDAAEVDRLRAALKSAIAAPASAGFRKVTGIGGILKASGSDYAVLRDWQH